MNKKRILTAITLVCMLLILTGCSANNYSNEITLDTEFKQIYDNEGIFSAVLTYPLAQAINYLDSKVPVFWAVTLVALGINVLLIAVTFKSNLSMQRMQSLQPEMQKIQKKYEGRNDQQSQARMSQEMNALYKKYDVNPGGALLVSFLQFPILIAMYSAVRRSSAVANGTFLGATLATHPMDAFKALEWPLIIIYVSMVIFQILSISMPQIMNTIKAKKEAEIHHKHYEKPQQQNAMMTYGMVVFIAYIMLNWPTALSLYYVIVSIINIVKTIVLSKITEKDN